MDVRHPDRREVARLPIELRVEYRRLNVFFSDYTKNISKGGTFLRTNRLLPVGTRFLFRLVLPQLEEPFELEGEVAWTREEGPDPGMGLRFVYPDEARRVAFEAWVEARMLETLGPVAFERLLGKAAPGR